MKRWLAASLALLFLAPRLCLAREAGWAPLPDKPWEPPYKPGTLLKNKKKQEKSSPLIATSKRADGAVYDGQPAVTEPELMEFIALLPQFRAWARASHEDAHPIVNKSGRADFLYSTNAADWVGRHGFAPARFFCVMGRMAACLAIIEEGNDMGAARPKDMPSVDKSEVALARKRLGELLTAGSSGAPIK